MYKLIRCEKTPSGLYRLIFNVGGGHEEEFKFYSIRFALVWPSPKNPAYFIGAGEEWWDESLYNPLSGRGTIRIVKEYEHNDLSLDSFFTELTDAMKSHLAECVYADIKSSLKAEDYATAFFSFLDRKRLKNLSVERAPYADDFTLRIGIVKSFDEAGDLSIDKGSPLYSELRAISRLDLSDPEVEEKFFRLNCLGYLLSAFQKYDNKPALKLSTHLRRMHGGGEGWMAI